MSLSCRALNPKSRTENVCETAIKIRTRSVTPPVAVALLLALGGLVGANKACLDKLNRLHAIARGDIYSEARMSRAAAAAHESINQSIN